jgi:hypothetical protein
VISAVIARNHIYSKQAFFISLFSFFSIAYAQKKDSALIMPIKMDSTKRMMLIGNDTTTKKNSHPKGYRSPRKASLFSAILPGLGQAYNRSYWKVPIIYAALGGLGYLTLDNHQQYQLYRKELIYRIDNPNQRKDFPQLEAANLTTQKEIFRRYRDLSGLGFILVYAANIIEANVDAQLMTYDMSDNLSLKWQPRFYDFQQQKNVVGLSLTFHIKH